MGPATRRRYHAGKLPTARDGDVGDLLYQLGLLAEASLKVADVGAVHELKIRARVDTVADRTAKRAAVLGLPGAQAAEARFPSAIGVESRRGRDLVGRWAPGRHLTVDLAHQSAREDHARMWILRNPFVLNRADV